MPDDAAARAGAFMRNVGRLEMALCCLGIRTERVSPQKWQKLADTVTSEAPETDLTDEAWDYAASFGIQTEGLAPADLSALIAATEMGRPRIEPELSISSVTTVSRNSVSRSIL